MVDWVLWHHKYNITAHTRGGIFCQGQVWQIVLLRHCLVQWFLVVLMLFGYVIWKTKPLSIVQIVQNVIFQDVIHEDLKYTVRLKQKNVMNIWFPEITSGFLMDWNSSRSICVQSFSKVAVIWSLCINVKFFPTIFQIGSHVLEANLHKSSKNVNYLARILHLSDSMRFAMVAAFSSPLERGLLHIILELLSQIKKKQTKRNTFE